MAGADAAATNAAGAMRTSAAHRDGCFGGARLIIVIPRCALVALPDVQSGKFASLGQLSLDNFPRRGGQFGVARARDFAERSTARAREDRLRVEIIGHAIWRRQLERQKAGRE